jgi:hypothetical protein
MRAAIIKADPCSADARLEELVLALEQGVYLLAKAVSLKIGASGSPVKEIAVRGGDPFISGPDGG